MFIICLGQPFSHTQLIPEVFITHVYASGLTAMPLLLHVLSRTVHLLLG